MAEDLTTHPERLRERLAGHHILITGSTGFLAKVFVEKLLRSVDTIGGLHLLVRPRSDGTSPKQRLSKDVLRSHAFNRLRASLGDDFIRLCDEKIHVVGGDLTKDRLGLDGEEYDKLTKRITFVVNSAATVTFDERLDEAVELNTFGPTRLLRFAKDCGEVPFMHVSTCYVCGARTGMIIEDFSAPESARESLPRLPDNGRFDLDGLVRSMRDESADICERFGTDTETGRRRLIEAGMRWARTYGWNDTYTFTKWLGEQLLIRDHGGVPLVVFRPAIIEGSFDEPVPGWIDGLRMADPIIVAFGRGKIDEFPGLADVPIDLVPVDFVANAMIATLPVGDARPEGVVVYQCASSARQPLYIRSLVASLERAFVRRPLTTDEGKPISTGPLRLVHRETFIRTWESKPRWVIRAQKWLTRLRIAKRRARRLSIQIRQIEQLIYFAKIYSPYTHLDCRFSDDALRGAAQKLHPDDRASFPFDTDIIDWDDYIVNRHVPGLQSFVLGKVAEPPPRILGVTDGERFEPGPAAEGKPAANLFALFERSAAGHPDKAVLQIKRNGRWIRYTYAEAMQATGTIMQRFTERGLTPGDRVAICAENGPQWGLTYLAAMRAGLTAIPLDPQLPAAEAWSAARFAKAKLMCAGRTTSIELTRRRGEEDCELISLTHPFIPPPGASRDAVPPPVPVAEDAIASILFTSGTTIAPKAVPLTHGNLMANATALLETHEVYSTDEFLSVLPMYHAFEFAGGFLVPLLAGSTITYVDQLKGAEILSAMQATGTTVMLVVPRLLKMFHDSIESNVASAGLIRRAAFRTFGVLSNWSGGRWGRRLFGAVHKGFGGRLRMLVSGGSSLDPELFDAFRRMGFSVYEGYGLTETSPVLTVQPPGGARRGSVGVALSNVELDIRNSNLEGIGEVWVKGPSVMTGYLDNDEATEEVMVDGWLRTGDLGRRDAEGYLHLTGRSKDLIITSAGKNVYPDEVEVRYRDLPFSKELCVFGVPADDGLGDAVHAVVVVDADTAEELDRSSIEREIRLAAATIGESLPAHQRIAVLHFWDRDLPKTSTMKAKRGLIRDMVCGEGMASRGRAPTGATAASDEKRGAGDSEKARAKTFAVVRRLLANQTNRPERVIHPDTHLLLDLGIDSIGKIDVIGAVEARFGMQIDDDVGASIARVSDLLRVIGGRVPKPGGIRGGDAWKRFVSGDRAGPGLNGRVSPAVLPMRWLARGAVGVLMNTYVRIRVRGRANIPATGAFILAPNHSSHLDTPSVVVAAGGRRRIWVAGAADYFFNTPIKRFVFGRLFDTIAFDRKADGVVGLRRCGDALGRGDGLLLFPEGTRSPSGRVQPFKTGVAVLAVQRHVPIVPVHIHRAFDLLRKGQRFIRPGVIMVSFGEPVYPPPDEPTTDHYAAFQQLTGQVRAAVDRLAAEVRA